jgi:hypothetical protein
MIETFFQVLVLVLIAHAAVYSSRIAKWSCARSVQLLTAGFVYIFVWRFIFTFLHISQHKGAMWIELHQTYFIIPAYIMWAWGIYLLYSTLTNLGRKHK